MKKIMACAIAASIIIAGCSKDNRKPPSSIITGKVVYQGQPLGVRSSGVQLELWQYGYQLFIKVPVYVAQDGSFSINVFDGNYKLVPLRGNGPWADRTDSINVSLNGSANVDVAVDPYFLIKNETFQRSGTTVNATLNLQRVNTTRTLEAVRVYVGQTMITDQTNNAANASKAASAITDITQPVTLAVTVPAALAGKDFVYARVGVKISGVTELIYSPVQKIALK